MSFPRPIRAIGITLPESERAERARMGRLPIRAMGIIRPESKESESAELSPAKSENPFLFPILAMGIMPVGSRLSAELNRAKSDNPFLFPIRAMGIMPVGSRL